MDVNTSWFKQRMAERGISGRQMAKLMAMDVGQYHRMLTGIRRMQPQEAAMVADLLGVSLQDVLRHAGVVVRADGPLVRIVGTIDDGKVETSVKGRRVTERPPGLPDAGEALRIVGGWADGAIAFYTPSRVVSPDAIGRLAVVDGKRQEKIFGILQRAHGEAGRYAISEYHSGRKLIENIILDSAAPVLWVKTG